jgi:glycosyltransferase involved in cell wall biosynthesis
MGLFSSTPRSYIDTFSQEMGECIKQTLASEKYDLVIASQLGMASYSQFFGDTIALLEELELGVLQEQDTRVHFTWRLRQDLTWFKHRRYLSRLLQNFQACTVVSEQEQRLLARTVPRNGQATVIPNCIDLANYNGVENTLRPNSLIFTGSFRYLVNYYAMVWFLQDIYPLIRSEIPDVQLIITGDHADLKLPSTTGVTQTGLVPDVRPLIASSVAGVVPLLSGGGTRLKILEAMALGTPVVTTTKGAEGLNAKHGESVLIADEPKEFAAAVVRLLKEPGLREHLADNAYQLVSEQYDWAGVMPHFLQLIEDTVLASRNQ